MNYGRLVVAALAATVMDAAYGLVVWGQLLAREFGRYPDIFRPAGDTSGFALMFLGIFVGMCGAAWIYAKGYEGGSGAVEGLKFGIVLGLLMAAYTSSANYGTMAIGKKLALTYLIGGFGEWLVAGIVIGLVYKPASQARQKTSRAAGV
jgi:hypothetical protein